MTPDPVLHRYEKNDTVWTITSVAATPNNHEPSKTEKKKFPWNKRSITVLVSICFTGLLLGCCYALMAPFFPQEAKEKENTATQFGLVIGIYQFVVFLTAPFYGKLLSKHVRAKPLLCGGMLVEGIFCSIMGCMMYSPPGTTFFALALTLRIIESLGFTAAITCCYAIVAAEFPDHVEISVPMVETTFGLGLFIGPFIGGFLYEAGGFLLPFVVVGCTLIVLSFLTAITFPQIEMVDAESTVTMKQVCDWRIIVNFLAVVSAFVTLGFNEGTLATHLEQFHLTHAVVGLVFMISGGVYASTCVFLGRICKSVKDPRYISIFGGVCVLVAFVIIGPLPFVGLTPTLPLVCISQVLLGVGISCYYICLFVHAISYSVKVKRLPDNLSTFALLSGIFSSAFSLGLFAGPVIGGLLMDYVGYAWGSLGIFSLQLAVILMLAITVTCDSSTGKLTAE
ncbi:MFS-type transporter SLC18B1-like isoform X2 [Ornithodoros turicata]